MNVFDQLVIKIVQKAIDNKKIIIRNRNQSSGIIMEGGTSYGPKKPLPSKYIPPPPKPPTGQIITEGQDPRKNT